MSVLGASLVLLGLLGAMMERLGRGEENESRATAVVRGALASVASLVVVGEALGATGHAGPRATLAALAVACAATGLVTTRLPPLRARTTRAPWTALDAGLGAALLAALASRLPEGLHHTTFLYDTLSYHLHAPATWMLDGRLSIVPAVFGDGAPAYAPSNVELLFWFLMAPLRSDVLAQTGQLPLAALACAAIVATAREAGARRDAALAAALAFLLVPEIWQQAPTAMTDLGMAAFFLAGLPFFVRLRREPRFANAVALGLAVGLCAGSKVVGLVFVAPLVALALPSLRRAPRAALATLVAVLATGGFWYLRNLVVTGNPLFPVSVKLGALTVFAGAVDAGALRASDYHLPVGDVAALGRLLLGAGLGFSLAGAVALARPGNSGRAWPLLAVALLAAFWLVLPYQESRFLFPLFGVAAIAMAGPRRAAPAWTWAPLGLAVFAGALELATPARWAALGLGVAVTFVFERARRRVPRRWALACGALACGALAVELGDGISRYRARAPGHSVGDELEAAWTWTRAHTHSARIAYAGNNLPFPLAGVELANDVRYVNVAGAPEDRLHDFVRRHPRATAATPEPAPYRDDASYETWRANLRATRRDRLFVAALYPEVRRTIAPDADGFPVERAWADAHPETFVLRFASSSARVYEVAP